MKIISHRGYWKRDEEKNTKSAFERSFSIGFGTETDVRDYCGHLVISHDIATEESMSFSEMLSIYNAHCCSGTLAINIKSDGLQEKLIEELSRANIDNYFIFDMSIPDMVVSLRAGLKIFARLSEYENESILFSQCDGIWLDNFTGQPLDTNVISKWIRAGKKLCIVSADLHKREHLSFWKEIKGLLPKDVFDSNNLTLCTDLPEEAEEYFNG